ncbi:hypothetical protein WJ972_18550 [Achromobacter insuavis]
MMDYSRNTFTVDSVGPPEPAGRSIAVPLTFSVQDGPIRYRGASTHTLRLRNNTIAKVTARASDPATEDALWRRLAVASGLVPRATRWTGRRWRLPPTTWRTRSRPP